MDFYLVRHGAAVQQGSDASRPLTEAGRKAVERLAEAAVEKRVRVAEIVHSGILRAQQTAEILGARLFPSRGVRPARGLLPQDDPMIGKAELETAEQPLMLVGHLPHLARLAGLLITGDSEREVTQFLPATLVCCSRDDGVWKISWILTA
ncbi:MAG TPA: phosphohistidine phosphatase SixA [Candidatus Eisenbacteria bacterium]|nr:phosphohistidine phosphatase SixA [Candidatus Eisenbacteria bacterium]